MFTFICKISKITIHLYSTDFIIMSLFYAIYIYYYLVVRISVLCVFGTYTGVGYLFPYGNDRRILRLYLNQSSAYSLETVSSSELEAGCLGLDCLGSIFLTCVCLWHLIVRLQTQYLTFYIGAICSNWDSTIYTGHTLIH